jgi:hypothetical protein
MPTTRPLEGGAPASAAEQERIDGRIRTLKLDPKFTGEARSHDSSKADMAVFDRWFKRIEGQLEGASDGAKVAAIVAALDGNAYQLYLTMSVEQQKSFRYLTTALSEAFKSQLTREQLREKIYALRMEQGELFTAYLYRCINLFNIRKAEYGEPMSEIEKKEILLKGLPSKLADRIKNTHATLHLQHYPSFDDYVQTIKPVINEYQSHQKDTGRFEQKQKQKSYRPYKFQRRTNAFELNTVGSGSESDSQESSDDDVNDEALNNAEDVLLAETEEEPVKMDNQLWLEIAMAKLGKRVPTCAICQKDGHVYRRCKIKPDKAAKERIALLHEQLAEWRRKSKEKNKEEKGGDKKPREQKEKSKSEVKEVLAIEIDDVQNNHIVQTASTEVLDEFDEFFKIEKRGIPDEARHLFATNINSVAIAELGDFEVGELEEVKIDAITRPRRQLPDDEFDVRDYNINPPLKREINPETMVELVSKCYIDSKRNKRSEEEQVWHEECLRLAPTGRDSFKCLTSMTVGGLRIHNILLDSSAQSNVISMGTMTRLAGLEKGAAFRTALKTCKWTPPTSSHVVAGLGGNTMAVQGSVLLPIEIKGQIYKMAFTLIYQPTQTMIMGTAGLRTLQFKLTSPLFGNVNFLDSPEARKAQRSGEDELKVPEEEKEKKNVAMAQKKEEKKKEDLPEQKKSVFKRKAEDKKEEEPKQKKRGRPPKQAQTTMGTPKVEKEIKDPMVRALLGQPPLSEEKKQQDFRQKGAAKKM